jgi:hypothetical protein
MRLATAFVEVRPDTKAFKADLQKQTEADARDVGKTLGQALAGGAFIAGAKRAVDAASSLQQAVGGTSAVFGESADSVEDWAQRADEAAGLSERAARELTSQIGGLLKGFGFTNDEAADLSVTLATLGADLAATFGGKPEEAVQALGAALRGETDPLERFGIALNQTLVNQKAVELGLAASTSAVDQNAKAQATLALITERSADAQGQFAREADTAAGQAAISAAKAENAAADLGENLLPIYTKLAEVVGSVADVFGSLPEPVQTAVIALAGVAALSGPVKAASEAVGTLATITRTALSRGLDTAAKGAFDLAGNLGKVSLGAGGLGIALAGATLLLKSYQDQKAQAARIEEEYTRILSEQTDGIDENTAAFAGQEILKGGLGEALRDADADVRAFTDGITEQTDRVKELDDGYNLLLDGSDAVAEALRDAGLEGSAFGDELQRLADSGALTDKQLADLVERLAAQADGYQDATVNAENKAAADEAAGVAAEESAPKVAAATEALDENEQAAKEAAESVDLFREAVEKALQPLDFEEAVDAQTQALLDLAEDVENRRKAVADAQQALDDLRSQRSDQSVADTRRIADAEEALAEARARVADTDSERAAKIQAIADAEQNLARAREDAGGGGVSDQDIADAQQAVADAIAATSTALDGNSEAALRNRDAIRELVDGAVNVIEKGREQGRSLEELQLIRAFEIDQLRDQLKALGFNEDQIEDYIEVIEDIPLTKATTITADTSKAEAKINALLEIMARVPTSIDAAVADRNLQKVAAGKFAAGGDVPDGLFTVGENGTELMRKQGANLEVIAGSPTQMFDAVGEDQLLTQREMVALLRAVAANTAGGTDLHRTARAGAA